MVLFIRFGFEFALLDLFISGLGRDNFIPPKIEGYGAGYLGTCGRNKEVGKVGC